MTAHPNDMTRSPAAGEAPKVRVVKAARGVLSLAIDHDDQAAGWALFRSLFGGHSAQLTDMMVTQLAELSRQGGEIAEPALNDNLGIVRGIAPRDTAELLLAMQMAAVHGATMVTARRLNGDKTPARQDSLFNALNKLARTYAMQMETLKRYRNGAPRPTPTRRASRRRADDDHRTIIREPPLEDREKVSEAQLGEAALGGDHAQLNDTGGGGGGSLVGPRLTSWFVRFLPLEGRREAVQARVGSSSKRCARCTTHPRAFPAKVDTTFAVRSATNQDPRALVSIQSEQKCSNHSSVARPSCL